MNSGEFAKWCGTNKRTLFLYDEIGLLKPKKIHENGYREYSSEQIEAMDMVKILQASGYTLKEIKEIVGGDSASRSRFFFDAKAIIDDKIAELTRMRNYISKKERLFSEYHNLRASGKEYEIEEYSLTYEEKSIDGENHFFGFINDGDYDSFVIDGEHKMCIFRESEKGITKRGRAISFFVEVPSESHDIVEIIKSKLSEFDFHGENMYYMCSLPHLLIEQEGTAIIKVTVFESA